MPVNIIHSTQGICNYNLVKQTKKEGEIFYFCEYTGTLKCPHCGNTHVIARGMNHRSFLGVPFGSTVVHLEMNILKLYCKECESTCQIKNPFAQKYKRYTEKFQEYVIALLDFTACSKLAKALNVSWDVIRNIEKKYLKRNFGNQDLSQVHSIAIDEIAVKKGRRYWMVVMNLERGNMFHVGKGKGTLRWYYSGND